MDTKASKEVLPANKHINIINQVSLSLLEVKEEREIFKIMADAIKAILPGAYFTISKLQPDDMNFRVIESHGFDHFRSTIKTIIGKDVFSMDFPFKNLTEEQQIAFEYRKFHYFSEGIHEVAVGALNKTICKAIEKLVGIEKVCGMSLCVKKKFFGGITFYIPASLVKSGILNTEAELAIESISNQASAVFQRLRDEAELIKQEEKLKAQTDELVQLNKTKDKFLSIIAHDLISPFNVIVGYSKLLMENTEEYESAETRLFAKNISTYAENTFQLLQNLLDWTRLQRGILVPSFQEYNLKRIIENVCTISSTIALNKNITLQNNVTGDIEITCDSDMTTTIFRNLISNAVKFSNNNQVITFSAYEKEGFIEVQIKDTGIGIPAEKIPNIFNGVENISTRGTADEKGTGLGLMLSKELIEKQGGEIRVESEKGKGSSFYVTLPTAVRSVVAPLLN